MRGVAALVLGLVGATVVSLAPAEAVTGDDFEPGFIISDDNFFNYNSMTVNEIQAFLDAKGPTTCTGCLKEYRASTYDRAADPQRCPVALTGRSNITAAEMIYDVSQACHINPMTLLVMLQKETSLVTMSAPPDWRYQRAMGYACPDSAPCDTSYYGLFIQLYSASSQLNYYGKGSFTWYPVGAWTAVRYHPNIACGVSAVYIQNRATAALYYYTPYQPNAAALANLTGTGDSCSSYGNRNFWLFYNNWFGDPTAPLVTPEDVAVSRIGEQDRYGTSVAISQSNFPDGATVVYVATGANFPDALSAAPAAASRNAPLLLTRTDALLEAVRDEIVRLAPDEIVVVGGEGSVSAAVFEELETLAPLVRRLSGDDRYATSREIARDAFGAGGVETAYFATGENFPDALSASAAAGASGVPVILVRGSEATLSPETTALIDELGATSGIIAGGRASVSEAIEDELTVLMAGGSVTRLGGADRFSTAGAINRAAFSTATRVYVASGMSYPDALSGAAVAGQLGAPLYVIPASCVPTYVLQDIVSLGVTEMVILGGTGVISTRVENFGRCS